MISVYRKTGSLNFCCDITLRPEPHCLPSVAMPNLIFILDVHAAVVEFLVKHISDCFLKMYIKSHRHIFGSPVYLALFYVK